MLVGLVAMVWACDPEVRSGDDDDGGTGGSGGAGGGSGGVMNTPVGQPPPPPDSGTPDGDGVSFAVSRMFLGGTDRSGAPNPSAWKDYGYNLDGIVTSAGDARHCQPAAGGKPTIMDDGQSGIDNAWGKQLLPLILSLANDAQEQVNETIAEGRQTMLFTASGIGGGTDYLSIQGRAYHGSDLGAPPAFDGTESWPVTPDSLLNQSDVTATKWPFDESYVNGNVLVMAPRGAFDVLVPGGFGSDLRLPLTNAIITMALGPDRNNASNGVIAGIIPVEAFVDEMRRVAGTFSQEFCSGTTIESLLDQIRQSADILVDGSQDPSRTCDGISLGLGFEAVTFAVESVGTPLPPLPDPCG
jgi:hypothetical protein